MLYWIDSVFFFIWNFLIYFFSSFYRNVFWNETGNLVCLATDDSYFILQVDTAAITAAIESKQGLGEDGLEDAFDVSLANLNVAL